MQAKQEQWNYQNDARVWAGQYRNSHNLPHWHHDCEVLFIERGSLNIFCNQQSYLLKEGQIFYIDSEQVHYMHAVTPDTLTTVIVFDYDIVKPFTEKKMLSCPLIEQDNYQIDSLYQALLKELSGKQAGGNFVSSILVQLLVVNIFRNEELTERVHPLSNTQKFQSLLLDIDKNYDFYTLDTAADFMQMNAAYFSRLFHKQMGMTFSKYLNYIKIEHAIDLLKESPDIPFTDIATRCGFDTIRNFNRVFKELTGFTPRSMPKDYVLKDNLSPLNFEQNDPTLKECVLLQSSDAS
jgi:AraC-like DNA-binding protein